MIWPLSFLGFLRVELIPCMQMASCLVCCSMVWVSWGDSVPAEVRPVSPRGFDSRKYEEGHLALSSTYILQSSLTRNKADIFIFICLIPTSVKSVQSYGGKGVWLISTLKLQQLPGSLRRVAGKAEKSSPQEEGWRRLENVSIDE